MSKFIQTIAAALTLNGILYGIFAICGGFDGTKWDIAGKAIFILLSIILEMVVVINSYKEDLLS